MASKRESWDVSFENSPFWKLILQRNEKRAALDEARKAGNAGLAEALEQQLTDYQAQIDAALFEASKGTKS